MVLKELILSSFYLGDGVVVLKEQNLLIFFKDLVCTFCMLHGFREPTTLIATEAEQESPAGNPNARPPAQTREGVTNYVDHHIST